MKKLILIIIFLSNLWGFVGFAQSGAVTISPTETAILDINSTNKGILIPSLTNTQMFGINNPATGLMVYNNTREALYMYDGNSWRGLLDDSYWSRPINNRDIISNATDSVGIGTISPAHRLDVNGNIRSRNQTIVGTDLITGNFNVGSNAALNGDITAFDNVQLDDPFGTLNFKTGNTVHASMGLSNYDLKLGSAGGDIIFRNQGTNRFYINNSGNFGIGTLPVSNARLTVGGNMYSPTDIGSTTITATEVKNDFISNSTTGLSENLLPLCYGTISNNSEGVVLQKTNNATITWNSTDKYYQINCSGINSGSTLLATLLPNEGTSANASQHYIYIVYQSAGVARVYTYYRQIIYPVPVANFPGADNFIRNDYGFHFVIYQ